MELERADLAELYAMVKRSYALQNAEAAVAVLKPMVDADMVLVQQWLGEGEATMPRKTPLYELPDAVLAQSFEERVKWAIWAAQLREVEARLRLTCC